jgi:hypothetical protein
MTGTEMTRQAAAKQLEKLSEILKQKRGARARYEPFSKNEVLGLTYSPPT